MFNGDSQRHTHIQLRICQVARAATELSLNTSKGFHVQFMLVPRVAGNYLLFERETGLAHMYKIRPHLGNKRALKPGNRFVHPETIASWGQNQ